MRYTHVAPMRRRKAADRTTLAVRTRKAATMTSGCVGVVRGGSNRRPRDFQACSVRGCGYARACTRWSGI